MHYANGRAAQENDPVVFKDYLKVRAGTLFNLNPSATSCNGSVAVAVPGCTNCFSVTISECYHAEDAFNSIIPRVEVGARITKPTSL